MDDALSVDFHYATIVHSCTNVWRLNKSLVFGECECITSKCHPAGQQLRHDTQTVLQSILDDPRRVGRTRLPRVLHGLARHAGIAVTTGTRLLGGSRLPGTAELHNSG